MYLLRTKGSNWRFLFLKKQVISNQKYNNHQCSQTPLIFWKLVLEYTCTCHYFSFWTSHKPPHLPCVCDEPEVLLLFVTYWRFSLCSRVTKGFPCVWDLQFSLPSNSLVFVTYLRYSSLFSSLTLISEPPGFRSCCSILPRISKSAVKYNSKSQSSMLFSLLG